MKAKILLYIACFLLVPTLALAGGPYYASEWGDGTVYPNCTAQGTPCSMSNINANIAAGETVYIIESFASSSEARCIAPAKSGESGNPITYRGLTGSEIISNDPNDGPIIASLADRDYITIRDLHFRRTNGGNPWVSIRNNAGATSSSNIILRNLTMDRVGATLGDPWAGIYLDGDVSDVKITGCNISDTTNSAHGTDDLIYGTAGAGNTIQRILIEDSTINGGCHAAVEFQTATGTCKDITIRNNTITTPAHIGLGCYNGTENVLAENNIIYDCGSQCDADSCNAAYSCMSAEDRARPMEQHPGMHMVGDQHIIRHNYLYNNGSAMVSTSAWDYEHQRIYNNTMWYNGFGYKGDGSTGDTDDVEFKNNIFSNHTNTVGTGVGTPRPIFWDRGPATGADACDYTITTNFFHETNDPKYTTCEHAGGIDSVGDLEDLYDDWVDGTNLITDPGLANPSAGNFTIGPNSNAIDAGIALTAAAGAGAATTTLIVDDARYFQAGGWAPSGDVDADYVAVGTVSNTAQISSINYSTNTITIAAALTWEDDDDVWLYKDSDGTIVLYGTAPDCGAYELETSGEPGGSSTGRSARSNPGGTAIRPNDGGITIKSP